MGRDTIQLEDAVSTISQGYLLEFTFEYGIPECLHPELPGLEDTIMDFPEGKVGVYTKFFKFANFRIPISQFLFDILGHYQIHLSQLSVIGATKVDERVFPTVVDWRTNAPKDGMSPADSYSMVDVRTLNTRRTPIQKQSEALLCLVGLSQNYLLGHDEYPTFLYDDGRDMDLFNLISAPNPSKVRTGTRPRAAHEVPLLTATANRVIEMEDTVVASGSSGTLAAIEKSPLDFADENPPPVITQRGDIATAEVIPEASLEKEVTAMGNVSTLEGKSLAAIDIEVGSAVPAPATQETPMSNPDPLSYAEPRPTPEQDIAQSSKKAPVAEDHDSEKSTSFTSMDVVDHIVPPGYFSELRHLPQDDFLSRYNINLAQQVAMGSQLRLRYEQEAKLLKKAIAQVARRDQRIEAREKHIKNLEALLEAEADMKKVAEAKNVQVTGEERIKAAFEEFKKYEDVKLEKRCAEIDARLDALSIEFDEELYPYMLTTVAGRRWVIGHGLRLTVMKCAESLELRHAFANVLSAGIAKGMSEGLEYGVKQGEAKLDLAAIEAYDPDADDKYVAVLHALKDLKYPLVRDPKDLWACKEEILLGDVIAANISRSEKKKKCRVVCRTHGVGSAHHARSDGVPVSAPIVAPQGIAIPLADTATQTEDEASPRLIRSKYLPPMYHLDWP
ncbi:hypothetical protein Tco_0950098 [Tanacetum coccineum]